MPTWSFARSVSKPARPVGGGDSPGRGPSLRTRLFRLSSVFLAASAVGAVIDVVGLSLQSARSVIAPQRVAITTTPAERALPYESVEFLSLDGLRLRGWFIPAGRSAIVLAHGHASNREGMLSQAEYLYRKGGYSVLLFDFRASGESEGTRSSLGYFEWQDVAGAVRYLKTRPEVDPDRIGALGASMGAAALLLMGEEAHQLKAVVADSSFASGETLVTRFDNWFRLPSFPFSVVVPLAIRFHLGLTPADLAPIKAIGQIAPTPVLIIHGERDSGIPAADAVALYQAAGEPKELWILPGVGHAAAWGAEREEYERRVLGFFRQYLGG